MTTNEPVTEPDNVLYRIQRGLAGYVSYLAACEMNEAFSEYILYEPMLRILATQRYIVECEYDPAAWRTGQRGDHKRIDFYAIRDALKFAIEVKWAQTERLNVREDYLKLDAIHKLEPDSRSFLCVFGKMSNIQNIQLLEGNFKEFREPVYADLKKTKFGCRIYEIQ